LKGEGALLVSFLKPEVFRVFLRPRREYFSTLVSWKKHCGQIIFPAVFRFTEGNIIPVQTLNKHTVDHEKNIPATGKGFSLLRNVNFHENLKKD
jgi:hypothetical protein